MKPYHVDFRHLRDEEGLAKALGCTVGVLTAPKGPFLIEHRIPKRNRKRGFRHVIEVDSAELRDALASFASRFCQFLEWCIDDFPHPACHGYTARRSILSNAGPHAGARWLLRADIREFFPTISTNRVQRIFLDLRLDESVAMILGKFLTYRGALPLGFPSSPLVANTICLGLDRRLSKEAQKCNARYTRYADDITFSSMERLPSKLLLRSILVEYGFQLAEDKFRIKKRGQALYVTGLSVTDKRPRAPRAWKRRLRQEIYYIEKFGLQGHIGRSDYPSFRSGINKIAGKIHFLRLTEYELAKGLEARFKRVLEEEDEDSCVYFPQPNRKPRHIDLFVDEAEFESNDKKLLAICVVQTEDADQLRRQLEVHRAKVVEDPFLPGRRALVEKRGLHWADLHVDLKTPLVKLIAAMPIRGYVAIGERAADEDYSTEYKQLLFELLQRRFISLDGADVTIHIEQNPQISVPKLKNQCNELFQKLTSKKSRRPRECPIFLEAKKIVEPGVVLPDCLLGALKDFITSGAPPRGAVSIDTARFERVRSKLRFIGLRVANGRQRVFSRWKPIQPFTVARPW